MIRKAILIFLFFFVLLAGVAIGYFFKPQVHVTIYDPTAYDELMVQFNRIRDDLELELDKVVELTPDNVDSIRRLLGMKPLVTVGPFHFYLDPTTGDFVIFDGIARQIVANQMTSGSQTKLDFYAKEETAVCSFTYEKNTGNLLQSSFNTYGKGGIAGLGKCSYIDSTGDGRFDRWLNFENGWRSYKLKGLQWVRVDDAKPQVDE